MSNRVINIGMIGLGFTIAVLVGLWLAIQASGGQAIGDLLPTAISGFIPSAILVGLGAYRYVQDREPPDEIPAVDVYHQRELVDLIHQRGSITVAEAAIALDISEDAVRDSVRQLLELQIFTGYIDWDTDTLYSQHTKQLG